MRLIDADRLPQLNTEYEEMIQNRCYYHRDVIRNAPTVEAIPIEWLKNELIPKAKNLGATDYVDNIMFVLEDWEAWKKYRG